MDGSYVHEPIAGRPRLARGRDAASIPDKAVHPVGVLPPLQCAVEPRAFHAAIFGADAVQICRQEADQVQCLAFNPLVSKYTYRFQTRMAGADVVFLNWGCEEDPPMTVPLAESDEPNRFPIQLYHRTATQADLSGKRVLEVGCGHGGGASYLMRTLRPVSYTGLDLNPAGIALCRKRHNLLGVDFVHGDAEKLPFPDQSFDAVINVESSGAYPHLSRFLAEVARVLRPSGRFLYADLGPCGSIAEWEAALAGAPIRMLSREVINAQVLRGMEKNTQRMLDLVGRLPSFLHRIGREYAGVKGTGFYRALQSGKYSYRVYCFCQD
jgi:ubiquinone/menaquinone biosynthesis C-methylase UbiE